MNPSRIIGAGLSGLIAAHAWPNVPIIEASPAPQPHRALLRFRTDKVARLTGIPFRKVLVRKGLWDDGKFREPTIALANAYSSKVLGRVLGDRSVWNLDPVERFIAPEDFQEQLLDNVRSRVTFACPDDFGVPKPIISTAPMPVVLNTIGIHNTIAFTRAMIEVRRWRVPYFDVHQTVYFPDPCIGMYRASITGDLLIVESMINKNLPDISEDIYGSFGIDLSKCEPLGKVNQEFGKIVSLADGRRKQLMFMLTHEHGVYSLGRFAQWRNILLDDVVDDIEVIKKLLASGSSYELRKAAS